MQICEAFSVMVDLGIALGIKPLNQQDGCWVCQIDEQWKIAVNGHKEPKVCEVSELPIEPFHCYVEYNGWPAGIMNPSGGCIAAGECANESTFIEAMRRRIELENKTKGKS